MVMLVSLAQASLHLRRDTDDDDTDLILKIHAASGAVINYLKDGATFLDSADEVDTDSFSEPIGVPFEVQAAVLLLVGMFYLDRDGSEPDLWERGYLPKAITALLYPLRDPAMA